MKFHVLFAQDASTVWTAAEITDAIDAAHSACRYWNAQDVGVTLELVQPETMEAIGVESMNWDALAPWCDANVPPGSILFLHAAVMFARGMGAFNRPILVVYTGRVRGDLVHELGHYLGARDDESRGDVMSRGYVTESISEATRAEIENAQRNLA